MNHLWGTVLSVGTPAVCVLCMMLCLVEVRRVRRLLTQRGFEEGLRSGEEHGQNFRELSIETHGVAQRLQDLQQANQSALDALRKSQKGLVAIPETLTAVQKNMEDLNRSMVGLMERVGVCEMQGSDIRESLKDVAGRVRKSEKTLSEYVHRTSEVLRIFAGECDLERRRVDRRLAALNSDRVEFLTEANEAIAVLEPASTRLGHGTQLQVSPESKNFIEALLHHGVRMLGQLAPSAPSTGRFVVRFSPDIARALNAGHVHLMRSAVGGFRAIAVNSAGQVVGQGTLAAASLLTPAAAGLLAWQVMAFVTAQKFLSDINRQLYDLQKKTGDIIEWLESEARGRIAGNLEYLRSAQERIGKTMQNQHELSTIRNQIEEIRRESMQLFEQHKLICQKKVGLIAGLELSGSLAEKRDSVQSLIDDFTRAHAILGSAVAICLTADRLLLPTYTDVAHARILLQETGTMKEEYAHILTAAADSLEQKIKEVKGIFTTGRKDRLTQDEIRALVQAVRKEGTRWGNHLSRALQGTQDQIASLERFLDAPVTVVIEVDEKGEAKALEAVEAG